jgi:hypothetical protein
VIHTSPDVVKLSSMMKGTNLILYIQSHDYGIGNSYGITSPFSFPYDVCLQSTAAGHTKCFMVGGCKCFKCGIYLCHESANMVTIETYVFQWSWNKFLLDSA